MNHCLLDYESGTKGKGTKSKEKPYYSLLWHDLSPLSPQPIDHTQRHDAEEQRPPWRSRTSFPSLFPPLPCPSVRCHPCCRVCIRLAEIHPTAQPKNIS